MADVRSLLRNERAQRKITHPQAVYSATGTLECTVCHIPLKSDNEVWNKHLKSTQHAMRAERLRLSTPKSSGPRSTREVSNGSKKRKASNDEDDSRKRSKSVIDVTGGFFDDPVEADNMLYPSTEDAKEYIPTITTATQTTQPTTTLTSHPMPPPPAPVPPTVLTTTIDEDEWAAFERDVATPPPESSIPALNSSATISAAPMTAADIAAQAREQANTQSKERREAELEGEKEDAARTLEDEFDEMEGLEARVKRLREMREALRMKKMDKVGGAEGGEARDDGMIKGVEVVEREEEEESDDEDEADGWGGWGH